MLTKLRTSVSPVTLLPAMTFLVSAWVAAVVFYSDLPDKVPSHWSVPGRPDGFTAKPWGAFVLPLTMTAVWLARPIIRRISLPKYRAERFPGAFDFRIMLTVGVVFLIWTLVIAQSVSWLRAGAVPFAVALVVGGVYAATMPFGTLVDLGGKRFVAAEGEWLRARRSISVVSVLAGLIILAIVAIRL